MAAISTIVAVGALAVAAGGTYMSYQQSQAANSARKDAAREQTNIRSEQAAQNAQQAQIERRQQAKEERVRRARITQGAVNTGTNQSSGMLGSIGNLATNLSSNLGINQGALASGGRISMFSQNAADASGRAAQNDFNAGMWNQFASLGSSIFGSKAVGGFDTLQSAYKRNF